MPADLGEETMCLATRVLGEAAQQALRDGQAWLLETESQES